MAETKIVQDQDILAEAVRKISESIQRLLASGINRRAIVVLLRDATGISKRDIDQVLDGLGDLEKLYTRKPIK